jgi:HAD superfamily hydrolase (TIGR01549 family)
LTVRAVLFDVDFTIVRPGPDLSPEGYERLGARHGLTLVPSRYDQARADALEALQQHPELEHDDEIWVAFTERIINGMGGHGEGAHAAAREMVAFWEVHANFELYEDVLPVWETLREHGLKIGLVSNTARDLEEFVAYNKLDVDAALASRAHGRVKPHRSIFDAMLATLEIAPEEAAMVGDSLQDDIEGARALGIRGFLLDRENRHPEWEDRLPDLYALPAALGLVSTG